MNDIQNSMHKMHKVCDHFLLQRIAFLTRHIYNRINEHMTKEGSQNEKV